DHLVAEPQHLFACPVGLLFRGLRPGLDPPELVAQLLHLRFQALKFFGVLRGIVHSNSSSLASKVTLRVRALRGDPGGYRPTPRHGSGASSTGWSW
ncbi:MAG: hypothetical protein JO118_06240, partial [Acetobacteraceae bacterium]|nr:hypothetical protein [Acetobacteraceae bacterium]